MCRNGLLHILLQPDDRIRRDWLRDAFDPHVAALFVKNFPRDMKGVFSPEALPAEARRAIIVGIRNNKVKITQKVTKLKSDDLDDL